MSDNSCNAGQKPYDCQFCSNRFKNKNEATRHENSIHTRLVSWSCAAISGFEAAFQPAASQDAVVCLFCGEGVPSQDHWKHLNDTHEFGQCNQTKEFFRADHFRQHLKHSHAGRSGKWTSMLENAARKEKTPALKDTFGG